MRGLVVTVAGTSSRFSESLGCEALKCIYHETAPSETLLARLLHQAEGHFDEIVVVGGYRFEELSAYLDRINWLDRLTLINNEHYADLGSGWSLHLGLKALEPASCNEVVFIEGDLYLDDSSVQNLCTHHGDAVSTSPDPVRSDRSVALYINADGKPRYAYSTTHGLLHIPEPFQAILSSGQAWRFADIARLMHISNSFESRGGDGTNLEIINAYFAESKPEELDTVDFATWINCNTIQDWKRAFSR